MKKTVIKGIVFTITFLTALFTISAFMNKGNTDMTGEMGPATYPLIYMMIDQERVNCLHGYAEQMNSSNLRDTITPLGDNREAAFVLEKFGMKIKGISFEVRSLDGTRLIEDTELHGYVEQEDKITCNFTIKDLIEDQQEYKLIFLVETEDGSILRYYTRMMKDSGFHTKEKLDFARDFHNKTFDKTAAQDITKYLESNSEGDNSSYHKVDIHSSFEQITWGNLGVRQEEGLVLDIKEMGTQTATLKMSYVVSTGEGQSGRRYAVEEFYRVRYTSDRIYLLEFERNMNQILDMEQSIFTANKISLGITGKDISLKESDGGNVFAFVDADRLYSYNVTDNKFAVLYGFYDRENEDVRTLYNAHDIKILNVDETGNVSFMVYGYMNRGRYEGRVGIQILRYSSILNTVEEEVFLPYHDSYDILQADVEQLSFINRSNILYLILKGSVYAIDLEGKQYSTVATDLSEERFRVSDSNRMIVWQEGDDLYGSKALSLMDLNTGKITRIEASNGNCIAPLAFMGEDLIFGEAEQEDVVKDSSGRTIFPMKTVKIQNENGKILKNYEQPGVYITGCSIEENQIVLTRVEKEDVTGKYISVKNEQLKNNKVIDQGTNVVETAVTENYETVVQIAVKSKINTKTLKKLTPKEVLFEGGREVILENKEDSIKRYYVYGKNGVVDIFTDPAPAISLADSISGVVTADSGSYVWMKGNRSIKNQIMAITGSAVTEEKNSLAVCLDSILKLEGTPRNTELMLNQGKSAMAILQEQMPDADILDLTGCSLDAVLYYVNRDIPVLASMRDGSAVLIIGFNELNIVLMDPGTGTVYKKGLNDSTELFEENGNDFITYIR